MGHTIAASGPVNLAYALAAMKDRLIAGNVGLREPVEGFGEWTLPKTAMSYEPKCVLINAFAFGGNNTSAVVRRWMG
jgi:3-oxoacyl-[acyl-carrier-protein] synthase II